MTTLFLKLLKWIATIIVGIAHTLLGALTLVTFWGWFVLPTFVSAPPLTLKGAICLLLAASIFQIGTVVQLVRIRLRLNKVTGYKELSYDDLIWSTIALLMWPVLLLVGYVWHLVL